MPRSLALPLALCTTLMAFGQRNIIGEYSTVIKYTWGSGLELSLKADSTFEMAMYELVSEQPVLQRPVTGTWTTTDSTRNLVLRQSTSGSAVLVYKYPFIEHDRMLSMSYTDSTQTDTAVRAQALHYYPMVLYKLKGYYPDGKLECELPRTTGENADDCPPSGIWKYYYANGVLEQETDYTRNPVFVTAKGYHENGVLKAEMSWKEDLRDGEWKEYDESGKLTRTLVYKKDELKKER